MEFPFLWHREDENLNEWVVRLAILAYLIRKKEDGIPRVTANEICKKAPEFLQKTQRPQRIQKHLEELKLKRYVESSSGGNYIYWEISNDGLEWYKKYSNPMRDMFLPIQST